MTEIAFGSPMSFLWLTLPGLLLLERIWARFTRRAPALRFSSADLVMDLGPNGLRGLFWVPGALRILALVCLAIAAARPQRLGPPLPEAAEGIDIMVAVDTSRTMLAADFQPRDRMSVAKQSIEEFIRKRPRDRIGLVVFAGDAATWAPLTLDHDLLTRLLAEVEVGMMPKGTAIGNAIATALNGLRESSAESRVIVLLTDGDNNAGEVGPGRAAGFAAALGVKIYPILIGRGGTAPFPAGKDIFGRPIYQDRRIPTNPALLEQIATITDGKAYSARDRQELESGLLEVLDRLETTRLQSETHVVIEAELFPGFVAAALILLLGAAVLGDTRLRGVL